MRPIAAALVALLATACRGSVPYYGASWMDDESLLVAGPAWGIVRLDTSGHVRQRWLGPKDEIVNVCARPGRSDCAVISTRDHVVPEGYIAGEIYSLDLGDSKLTRLTHDDLDDRFLCAGQADSVWVFSETRFDTGLLSMNSRNQSVRQINLNSGVQTAWLPWRDWSESTPTVTAQGAILLVAWQCTALENGHSVHPDSDDWDYASERMRLRYRVGGRSERVGYDMAVVELMDVESGEIHPLYREIEYEWVYDLEVSPGERFVSFISKSGADCNRSHRLHIVDCASLETTIVELPLDRRSYEHVGESAPR